MARILGIEIPNEKRIEASLPYMFGIGRPTAAKILEHAGIDPNIRTGQLTEDQLVRISQVIQTEGILVEGDLRRERQAQMKRLTSINCYRGIRQSVACQFAVNALVPMPAPARARRRPWALRSNPIHH